MPAINLRKVDLELRADLRRAAAVAGKHLEEYCVLILKAHLLTLDKSKSQTSTPKTPTFRRPSKPDPASSTTGATTDVTVSPLVVAEWDAEPKSILMATDESPNPAHAPEVSAFGKKCPHGWMNWLICNVCNPKHL